MREYRITLWDYIVAIVLGLCDWLMERPLVIFALVAALIALTFALLATFWR
jgi:hypothetical protein